MRESDIVNSILLPLFEDAGYETNEVKFDYNVVSYVSKNSSGIRLRPDIVLFEGDNNPILVIETKSPWHMEKLEDATSKPLMYSDSLNIPIYALTDGNMFILFSKDKGEIIRIQSISDDYERLVKILAKDNLKKYSSEIKKQEPKGFDIELDKEWIDQINNELFIFNEDINEVKSLGARIIGYLGDKAFEKFCRINDISAMPVMVGKADFIVGNEKVFVKAMIEQEGEKRKRSIIHSTLNQFNDSILVLVVIHAVQNDTELLGYSFKKASIIGYIRSDAVLKSSSSLSNKQILKRSDFMPIGNWLEQRLGGDRV